MKTGSSTAAPDQQMIEENPDNHPAVEAWLALDKTNRKPDAVTALFDAGRKRKKKNKSAVYKLENACRSGTAVVAKRGAEATVKVERIIYESILPKLPVSSLDYYGSIQVGGEHWLFIEYANGVEWQYEKGAHSELAVQWLAEMHCASMGLAELSVLPARDPLYYRSQLNKATNRIYDCRANPAFRRSDLETLDRFLEKTNFLESRWPELERIFESFPVSLVHNDFVKKNIHVRNAGDKLVLFPFDWEMSGRGVPTVDLKWMLSDGPISPLGKYQLYASKLGITLNQWDLRLLAALGALFRVCDGVEWISQHLLWNYPRKKIASFDIYAARITEARSLLGWSH